MRDDVYNKFEAQMKPIIKDCRVTKETAENDPKKYGTYEMRMQLNTGKKFHYNRELAKSHKNELREIYKQVPHGFLANMQLVSVQSMFSDTLRKSINSPENIRTMQIQSNFIETFFALSQECGLVEIKDQSQSGKNNSVFVVLNEPIRSQYGDRGKN